MEGYYGQMPPALIPRFWAPGWNSWQQSASKFQQEVGGPLRGGDPGKRLIEPSDGAERPALGEAPPPFERMRGEWLAVPLYHIFGSEELSILSPGIAERSPEPYLGLNPGDASALGLAAGAELSLPLGGVTRGLQVRLIPSLPAGVAGLPVGLPGLLGVALPTWIRLSDD